MGFRSQPAVSRTPANLFAAGFFLLFTGLFLTFIFSYRHLKDYDSLATSHNLVNADLFNLARLLNNAAVTSPQLSSAAERQGVSSIFAVSGQIIEDQVKRLQKNVRDTVNIRLVGELKSHIDRELPWLLVSDVADSILANRATVHVREFLRIDSILHLAIDRTAFLVDERKTQLAEQIYLMQLFIWIAFSICTLLALGSGYLAYRDHKKTIHTELETTVALNRIKDGIISVDNQWRYTFLNSAALANYPEDQRNVLGQVLWDVHPGMEKTDFGDMYRRAKETNLPAELTSYYAPSAKWLSVKAYPGQNGMTIFYEDVSKVRTAEIELAASTKETRDFRFALDESSIVAITDQNGTITHANRNFARISGYEVEELLGQDHRLISSRFHPKSFIKDLWKTIGKGHIWRGEMKNRAKDGSHYWVDTTIVPFLDHKGKPYQYIAIRSDITARKIAEEELVTSEQSLLALNIGLEQRIAERTEELAATNQELETFSYSISHDLRAPLRGITGFVGVLEEDFGPTLDPEARRLLSIVQLNAQKMGTLIDDLLTFFRTGKQELKKTTINTNKLVGDLVTDISSASHSEKITWRVDDLPSMYGDLSSIRQVLINLLSNVVKYTGKVALPCIHIGVMEKGERSYVFIRDNGAGFNQDYGNKLFKIFQRLHNADEFEGTGIGLALVEKIVHKHGGRIFAESAVNQGATFYFYLPPKPLYES